MFKSLIFVTALVALTYAKNVNVKEATVTVIGVPGDSTKGIIGKLTLKQNSDDVTIEGTIEGLPVGKHGLTVHAFGDVSGGTCGNVGDHFNPHKKSHGAQTASKSNRHVGDLGNIEADASGKAPVKITDKVISLNGEDHVVGKAFVVHTSEDDLGKGTGDKADESKKNGNVGAPIACGIVGMTSEKSGSSAVVPTIVTFVVAIIFRTM